MASSPRKFTDIGPTSMSLVLGKKQGCLRIYSLASGNADLVGLMISEYNRNGGPASRSENTRPLLFSPCLLNHKSGSHGQSKLNALVGFVKVRNFRITQLTFT